MQSTESYNEYDILLQIAQGNETAFEQLFHHYRDRVYSICFKLTQSIVLSEEIVQDVFLKIWVKRAELSEIIHFRAYLFTMVRNHIYNSLKALTLQQVSLGALSSEELTSGNMTDVRLLEKENARILAAAINRLPPQQQLVYKLINEHGMKREEVSQKIGVSPETVKSHIAQAMRSIRAYCLARINITILLILIFQ